MAEHWFMRRIRGNGHRPTHLIGMVFVLVVASLSACASPGIEVRAKVGSRQASNPASNQEVDSYYARGKSDFANARFGLAVRNFGLALLRNPGSVETLNALAASYDRLGRYDLAMRYYRKALKIDPNSIQTINNIGYSYYSRGDAELAALIFSRIGEPAGTDPVVAGNLRLARAAMESQHHRCRAANEDAAGSPATPRSDEIPPQRKLRIVPIGSGLQRLVIEPDQERRPAKSYSGKSAAAKRVGGRKHGRQSAVSAQARFASGQAACSSLIKNSRRRSNAAEMRTLALDQRLEAESKAVRNDRIELPVNLVPELIELKPELIGPIGSDNQNEPT